MVSRRFVVSVIAFLVWCIAPPWLLHRVRLSGGKQSDSDVNTTSHFAEGYRGTSIRLKPLLGPYLYMDEGFHVPQCMQYALLRDFTTWDPMITTPPGAYAGGILAGRLLELLDASMRRVENNDEGPISNTRILTAANIVTAARLANAVTVLLSFLVARWLFGEDHLERALCSVLYPPAFFFVMLYYTDPSANLAMMLIIALYVRVARRKNPRLGILLVALAGICGVTVRQTTIVWLFFVGVHHVAIYGLLVPWTVDGVRRRGQRYRLLLHVGDALSEASPLVVVGLLFIGFVVWNDGSVVLGDRTNHVPALHLAQLPYFFASVAAFSPAVTLHRLISVDWRTWQYSILCLFVVLPFFVYMLRYHAVFHPYLIADNRHYTSVLYRYVLRDDSLRCALAVPALGGLVRCCTGFFPVQSSYSPVQQSTIERRVSIASDLLFVCCLAMSVVPQGLLESRYFAVPMLFVLAHDDRRIRSSAYTLDALWMALINLATFYIFFSRPFAAPDGSVGRFMW